MASAGFALARARCRDPGDSALPCYDRSPEPSWPEHRRLACGPTSDFLGHPADRRCDLLGAATGMPRSEAEFGGVAGC